MLSQLTLRFHKKLIEALKIRAGHENTSVNALAARFLDDGLKTAAAGDGYFQLVADPEATVRQLYRYIILGQTFGTAPVSRDELRFILAYAREAFICGQNRLQHSRPCAPCSTSPATCWPGRLRTTARWTGTICRGYSACREITWWKNLTDS